MSKHKLLKRITPPPVTRIVAEAPEGEPLSMDEINEIVHEVRRQVGQVMSHNQDVQAFPLLPDRREEVA